LLILITPTHSFLSFTIFLLASPPPPNIYTLSLHDALPIFASSLKLDVNPTNGVTEITLVDKVDPEELEARLAATTEETNSEEPGYRDAAAVDEPQSESALSQSHDNEARGEVVGESSDARSQIHYTFVRPTADPVFADNPLTETLGSVSDTQLVSELGMWRNVVAVARACRSVDELLDRLDALKIPEWQSDALLDLASGTSYTDVAKKLFGGEEDRTVADEAVVDVPPIAVLASDEGSPDGSTL